MRAESRQRELALRAALGASRSRIVGQVLMESGVLATVASAIGLALTMVALPPLMRLVPAELPRPEWITVDLTVVLFTVLVAFAASLFAGVLPAVFSVRADAIAQLRSGGRGLTTAASRFGRRALVVSQVALAVMILVTAGLLTQSLSRLQSVDLGLSSDALVLVDLALPQKKYADPTKHAQFLDQSIERLERESAITAVTPVNVPPFAGIGGWDVPHFAAEGHADALSRVDRPRPTLYVPAAQFQMTAEMLALRTTASLGEVARLTRATVQDIDAGVHVMRVQPFSGMLHAPLAGHRFSMRLAAIFAVAALTLTAVSLYAVMAASVGNAIARLAFAWRWARHRTPSGGSSSARGCGSSESARRSVRPEPSLGQG